MNRRELLKVSGLAAFANKPERRRSSANRRFMYNYDAWGPFLKGHTPEAIRANIDMFSASQITTVMLSPNLGQSVSYPSAVSEMCHWRPLSPDTRDSLYKGMGDPFAKATEGVSDLWRNKHVDGFGLLVARALEKKLETFVSIRMNDVHMARMEEGQGPYTDAFYRAHPEWRLHNGGLNYAVPEVRAHRLSTMEELLRKYAFDGIELDFLRGPPYFASDQPARTEPGSRFPHFPRDIAEKSAPIMAEFIGEVRRMTHRVAKEKGRKIALSVRVPSSLSGCRRLGLDPVIWNQRGLLDFLTVGCFLQLFFDLPIGKFKRMLPRLPVYASVDYIVGGPVVEGALRPRDATPEIYQGVGAALYAAGADGLCLFNMYVSRGNGPDPAGKDWSHDEPAEVLKIMGDPATLEGKNKLYLVDARFELFDMRFFDQRAQLPADATPDSPLLARMTVGEKQPAERHFTLRVVTAKPLGDALIDVQVNGRSQGPAKRAARPHLFPEPYDQLPPELARMVDFNVRGDTLTYGANEIAVLSSKPITVTSIELAVADRPF